MTDRKSIIIVEDDFILAKVTQLQLARLGFDVLAIFSSGEQVLQGLENMNPDLILMDIQLSGKLDGIQTVETIRLQRQIPVIFVTGNSDMSTKVRALNTQCKAYLVKPVEKTQLEQAVLTAFNSS